MDVTAALYSHGTLLLAESSGPDANATKLLLAARNYTLPPPSINTNTVSQSVWLREVVSELSQLVPGERGVAAQERLMRCLHCKCQAGRPALQPAHPLDSLRQQRRARVRTPP